MISSILLLNQKGEVLILRAYRDNVSRAEIQAFAETVVAAREIKDKPIWENSCGTFFLHVQNGEIAVVATTKYENADPNTVLVFKLLYKIVDLLKSYLCPTGELNEGVVGG